MKRLLEGATAFGSLALFVAMIVVVLPQVASSQPPRDDTTYEDCFEMQIVPPPCKGDKVLICHFNEGADFGKTHCQEPSKGKGGYESHVGTQGHGHKDFCITTVDEIFECIGKEPPPDK
jgi:hypothetical protein